MPSERVARLHSGRIVVLRSPPLPLVRHYHVLAWADGQGAPTIAEIDEMWILAHAFARELGERLLGDPQCFSVLYNGERTRRMPWPHFHLILANTPAQKRWTLLCMSCKRWLRPLWSGKLSEMSRRFAQILSITAVALLASCTPESPTWADLDRDERLAFMTNEVEPTMRAIFQARDAVRWSEFACETCHGGDAVARDYEMPNVLGALPLDNTIEVAQMRNPEMTAFMLDDVFPTMAELLDEPKFNEETEPDGFRCVRCHVVAP